MFYFYLFGWCYFDDFNVLVFLCVYGVFFVVLEEDLGYVVVYVVFVEM